MLQIGDMRYVEMFLCVTLTFRLNFEVKHLQQLGLCVSEGENHIILLVNTWNIMHK